MKALEAALEELLGEREKVDRAIAGIRAMLGNGVQTEKAPERKAGRQAGRQAGARWEPPKPKKASSPVRRGKLAEHEGEIKRLWESGMSAAKIAAKTKAGAQPTISKLIRERGWKQGAPVKAKGWKAKPWVATKRAVTETSTVQTSGNGEVPVRRLARGVSGREGDLD